MNNPLLNNEFLQQLDAYPHRTVYAKIILLNFDEQPIKEIQGYITQGTVNIDGASAVRRTCSLTMTTEEKEIDTIYWGLKNKFKLEIGLENKINSNYPDIIWFKQGLYIITQLSESLGTNGHTISISGKDKGCLLNGDIGGAIPSTTNFGVMDYNEWDEKGNIITTTTQIPIKSIIQNIMVSFANEPIQNIVLNDIDNYGMELMSYKGDNPLYFLYDEEAGMVTNMTFNGRQSYQVVEKNNGEWIKTGSSKTLEEAKPNNYVNQAPNLERTFLQAENGQVYSVIKIMKDESVGYRKTELTYPGDLIANPGETVSSVLDKIKNMFSTFEYFYDVDGRFVFQEKKNYLNSSWNNIEVSEDEIMVNAAAYSSPTIYSFEDNQMLTAISKQPTLTNLKNDFSIQGVRKSATGADILIHMRYAICDKPQKYYSLKEKRAYVSYEFIDYEQEKDQVTEASFNNKIYYIRNEKGKYEEAKIFETNQTYYYGKTWSGQRYDWRELIYQMAIDYFAYGENDNFLSQIAEKNSEYFPTGKTGYEMFYTDIQGFWRQIYNPQAIGKQGDLVELDIFAGTTGLFNTTTGFNDDVANNPAVLNFWFDFMDTNTAMGQYSIGAIGHRPKAVNDSKAVAIYYKQIPQVLFISQQEIKNLQQENFQDYYNLVGYNFIQIPDSYEKYFSISNRGKSAQDVLDDLLYQHLYCTENITLTSVPIYYLQPNYRIFVRDDKTQINGEYLVNKITIPLTYNGTSSISAQLAPTRLY